MLDEKPEAMQGYYGPGPGPGAGPGAYQDPFRHRFPFFPFFFFFPFLFRIPPRHFIGFMPRPRRFGVSSQEMHEDLCIRCISEAEYASMVRMGFTEVEVMT